MASKTSTAKKSGSRKPRSPKAPVVQEELRVQGGEQTTAVASAPAAPAPEPKSGVRSVNTVRLVGRLVADPQVRYTTGGHALTRIRVATTEGRTPQYHDVAVWRDLAELVADAYNKGDAVQIDGRLTWHTWTTPDGRAARRAEVVASNVLAVQGS